MRDENTCIVCGHELPSEPLMTFDGMPASAQNIPGSNELGEDRGITLRLYQCSHCGLVQFDCRPVDYYRDVIRSGGFSTTMVELRRSQYRHLIETYELEGKRVLEAGCGQGEFLAVLKEFPVKAYGIEHREDLVKLAVSRGLSVWKQFADGEDTVIRNPDGEGEGPFDVFLSFNFLEHQPDPVGMLKCLYRNLTEDGMGLLTVPSLEYILEHDGYYELIRDHLAYYTFDTLRFALEKAGFTVLEQEMINRDTLSVIVRKRRNAGTPGESLATETAGETDAPAGLKSDASSGLKSDVPAGFKPADVSGLEKSRKTIGLELEGLFERLEREGKSLAVWGASHQGFTLAATTVLGEKARYIIDSAPFKQGRYAPASHLPIVAPEEYFSRPVDAILIAAPGYTEEIAGKIRELYGAGVERLAIKSNHLERLQGVSEKEIRKQKERT